MEKSCGQQYKWDAENKRVCHKHLSNDDYEDELQARLLNIRPKVLKATCNEVDTYFT